MKINTISYFIKDAFKSLKRNTTISFASIITVLITFFVLGVFSIIASNVNNTIENVQSKIEAKVFLKDDIKLIDQREIEIKLREVEGVEEVTYLSKEDEYKNLKEKMGEKQGLLSGYTFEKNPCQASFSVKLKEPEYISNVSKEIKNFEGVESISDQQESVDKIVAVTKGLKFVGYILFVILVGVSIFLIMNTTKLTVYSRRREVGIMKFVGATDWFIRWPFVIEGMVIGLTGSLLACVSIFFSYKYLFQWFSHQIAFINIMEPMSILSLILVKFIVGGILVGGFASMIALRKFLVV